MFQSFSPVTTASWMLKDAGKQQTAGEGVLTALLDVMQRRQLSHRMSPGGCCTEAFLITEWNFPSCLSAGVLSSLPEPGPSLAYQSSGFLLSCSHFPSSLPSEATAKQGWKIWWPRSSLLWGRRLWKTESNSHINVSEPVFKWGC